MIKNGVNDRKLRYRIINDQFRSLTLCLSNSSLLSKLGHIQPQSVGVQAVDISESLKTSLFSSLPPRLFFTSVMTFSQKLRGRHVSRPCQPFWGPLVAIFDLTGGVVLQAESNCPRLVLYTKFSLQNIGGIITFMTPPNNHIISVLG